MMRLIVAARKGRSALRLNFPSGNSPSVPLVTTISAVSGNNCIWILKLGVEGGGKVSE
jgi:hypothetical protein